MAVKKSKLPMVYDMTSEQCIWSAAGVVPYRLCTNAFDCASCPFDQKMVKKTKEGTRGWRERARRASHPEQHRCRHMLSGYVSAKYCSNYYDCGHCEFDQMVLEEVRSQQPPEPDVELVEGFALAPNHYYARSHTWARVEYGGQVRVGMDDFAARLFGPAGRWKLPELGTVMNLNVPLATMERTEGKADLLDPVQGMVVAVNPKLESEPESVNASPYGEGWLVMLQPTQMVRNLRSMVSGETAENWLKEEADRLNEMVYGEREHRIAATGGRVVQDIFGSVKGLSWEKLVDSFLKG